MCLALCYPADGSLAGSSVHGILQERILEWVVISFSNACIHAKLLQSWLTLCDPMDVQPFGQQPTIPLYPWDSLGKNSRVGCHFLLQNGYHKKDDRDSPGSPVVKTLCFHCRGMGLIPGQGTKILNAVWYGWKQTNKLANVGKDVEKRENLYDVCRNINWCSHCEK